MEHVVSEPVAPFSAAGGALRIHQVPSASDNLIWLVEVGDTHQVWAVDGPAAGEVLDYCESQGLTLVGILNTHTHGDHIGINFDLEQRGLISNLEVIGYAGRSSQIPGLTRGVEDGDTVTLGDVVGRVLLTEGHIDGHISFVFDDVLFCGDTLFAGGCGYLFDGPPETMFQSLLTLAELDGDTRVCCAHEYTQDNLRFAWSVEPDNQALAERIRQVWAVRSEGGCAVPSTIEEERATNPFLRPGSPTLKALVSEAWPDRDLSTPAAVFAATRALKDTKQHREQSDSVLPLS